MKRIIAFKNKKKGIAALFVDFFGLVLFRHSLAAGLEKTCVDVELTLVAGFAKVIDILVPALRVGCIVARSGVDSRVAKSTVNNTIIEEKRIP